MNKSTVGQALAALVLLPLAPIIFIFMLIKGAIDDGVGGVWLCVVAFMFIAFAFGAGTI